MQLVNADVVINPGMRYRSSTTMETAMSALPLLFLIALQAPAVPPPEAEPLKKKDVMICRRGRDLQFGSHMSAPRTCKLKSEWAAEAADARRELKSMNERGNNPTPIPGARPIQ